MVRVKPDTTSAQWGKKRYQQTQLWEELIGDRATAKIGAAPLVPDDAVQEPGSNEDDQQLPNNRDYLESVPAVISFEIYPVFPRKVHFGTIQFDHGTMKICMQNVCFMKDWCCSLIELGLVKSCNKVQR